MAGMAAATGSIEADFEVLEAIGRQVEAMIDAMLPRGEIFRTLRQWLTGHGELPEAGEVRLCLMTMAADLELFTPSASGVTAVDRHCNKVAPKTPTERAALAALGAAQFRLVRILGRESQGTVRLKDLVTDETLLLLDAYISPAAAGLDAAMRLCPLPSGRHVLISPLFALDETTRLAAMKFARPGKPLGHRCAASLYRDVARRGFLPVPQYDAALDAPALADEDGETLETEVERLAMRWIGPEGTTRLEALILEARQLASVEDLVDACGHYSQAGAHAPEGLKAAFERIAALQVETIVQRQRAGLQKDADALDAAAALIAHFVAQGAMAASAADLLRRLRLRWSARPASGSSQTHAAAAELERVIQRIQALRAKTVERGCTEEEAMAAAAKVAELLDRHDLSLDEVSLRNSDCLGVNIATGRKRRAPIDSCLLPLARFCDCHVWSEEHADGTLHYTLFGLRHDVEAARFLHELIEATFETESAMFRYGDIYLSARGGERRVALNSFQVGLASGISTKLATLKAGREASKAKSTGFDLVATKHAMVHEEIARLGLNLTTRTRRNRRYVHGEAFAAGKAAGSLFEPHSALAG